MKVRDYLDAKTQNTRRQIGAARSKGGLPKSWTKVREALAHWTSRAMTREGCGARSLPSESYESCSWLMFKGQPCQTWPLSVELRWVVQTKSWPAPKATKAQFQGRSGLLLHQNGNPCPLVGMPTTFERTTFLWGRFNGGQH